MLGLTRTITKLSELSRLWLHLIKILFIHNVTENITKKSAETRRKTIKNEKRCRNGVPKNTQTRKDKSDGKNTKPTSFHKRIKRALYLYHHFYPSLFVYFLAAIPTSLFMIFLSC